MWHYFRAYELINILILPTSIFLLFSPSNSKQQKATIQQIHANVKHYAEIDRFAALKIELQSRKPVYFFWSPLTLLFEESTWFSVPLIWWTWRVKKSCWQAFLIVQCLLLFVVLIHCFTAFWLIFQVNVFIVHTLDKHYVYSVKFYFLKRCLNPTCDISCCTKNPPHLCQCNSSYNATECSHTEPSYRNENFA